MGGLRKVGTMLPAPVKEGTRPDLGDTTGVMPVVEIGEIADTIERRRQHEFAVAQAVATYWRDIREGKRPSPPPGYYEPADGLAYCETCRGGRFLRKDVDYRDPDFGRMYPCPDCIGIVTQRRMEKLLGTLPSEFRDWTFETFPVRTEHRKLLPMLHEWLADESEPRPWLYLYSRGTGRGKTGLAIALLKSLIDRGESGHFHIVPDMLDAIRNSYSNREAFTEDGSPTVVNLRSVDNLVLDDIGTERDSDWAIEQLFELIAFRHANGRRTMVTSNCTLEELGYRLRHDRTPRRIKERAGRGRWVLDMSPLPDLREADSLLPGDPADPPVDAF